MGNIFDNFEIPVQNETTLSLSELVQRARGLQPLLSKNAPESDRNRRASEENIQAVADADLFKLMVPKRYGGYEGTIRSHLEISAALGEACGGTSWVVSLINGCAWFAGLFPQQAQDDVLGTNPDARISGVFTPSTQVRRVEVGWSYRASGSFHRVRCTLNGRCWDVWSMTRTGRSRLNTLRLSP
jgi:3-hydroxy-9,10-secoandrosta-1,3,5(10)-triene-9,17-dione monooxygenase